jgi:hypothetical protein
MNYDRFLEIHFVSSNKNEGTTKILPGAGRFKGLFQYDFTGNDTSQRDTYRNKLQGRFIDAVPRMDIMFAGVNGLRVRVQQANAEHLPGVICQGAQIQMPPLDPLHYVSCHVDLEGLLPGNPVLPALQSLVEWVCAKQSASGASIAGKMRLNCHGSNHSGAGLTMGETVLSPDDLVDALIRHGLGARAMQNTVVPRYASEPQAKWKADNKVNACENCKNQFSFVRRKHHCRRCGCIFCDACTKKRRTVRNPLSEEGRATGAVKDCRVCDRCAAEIDAGAIAKLGLTPAGVDTTVSVKAGRGLTQITLALCLTASSSQEFATAKTGFVRNSIAARLLKRLSMKGIHGIQVSGSNEAIAWSDSRGTLVEPFGLMYPGMSADKKKTTGKADDPFEGTEWAGADTVETSITIPCFVLGSTGEPNFKISPIINEAKYASIRDQRIVPVMGGNRMAFGRFPVGTAEAELVNEAVSKWKLSSWRRTTEPVANFPELTREATDLASIPGSAAAIQLAVQPRSLASLTAALSGAAPKSSVRSTIVVDAPQRRVTIRRYTLVPDTLIVTGLEDRRYKDYKIQGVS